MPRPEKEPEAPKKTLTLGTKIGRLYPKRYRGRFSRIDNDGDAWLTDSDWEDDSNVCVCRASLRPAVPPADRVANETPAPATTPARSSGPPRAAEDSGRYTDPRTGETYNTAAWGVAIPAVKQRPHTTCNEPGCLCPYCRHRGWSPKLGANDPRYNGGKGPAHSTLDESIAAAKPAPDRRDPADWDCWDSEEPRVS